MNMVRNRSRLFLSTATLFILAISVVAEDATPGPDKPTAATADQAPQQAAPTEEAQAEALQKAVQNPVASLISVPLQNNTNLSYGPYNRTQDVLNLQPVIPIKLSENWNLISRIIQPVWQPYPNQNTGGEYWQHEPDVLSVARQAGKLIWGAGPAVVIPTATSAILGRGKLSMGPSVVLLMQPPHWTLRVLIYNVWSAAGSEHRRSLLFCRILI